VLTIRVIAGCGHSPRLIRPAHRQLCALVFSVSQPVPLKLNVINAAANGPDIRLLWISTEAIPKEVNTTKTRGTGSWVTTAKPPGCNKRAGL